MIRLRSLGACEIHVGDALLMPTSRTLFAAGLYLAIEATRPIMREQLLELLWPDADTERANHSLRQMFYRLRAYGVPLDSDAERVILPPRSVSTDYDELLAANGAVPSEQLLALIPGGFLPGYMPRGSRRLTDWVEAQRARVNGLLARRFLGAIAERKTTGDWPAVEALAQRCIDLDPLNDAATLALAEAMAMSGSRARAIAMIDRHVTEIGTSDLAALAPALRLRNRIADLYTLPAVIERDPPQTGREWEMAELGVALESARAGLGSAYLISGPPGIGKTRLVSEFTRAAQLQGIRVARANVGRHDQQRPLGTWADLIPHMKRMPGALGCDPASLSFLARLTASEPEPAALPPVPGSAESLFAHIRLAILDLVGAVASESCVIVVIEDVHWIDPASWDVLSALTQRLHGMSVLLLINRREGEEDATAVPRSAMVRAMPLAPLDASACRRLFGLTAPDHRGADTGFMEWCIATSAGNPYFLIELALRSSETDGRFQAPASLIRLVARRFLGVTPLARRVLQAAAVLGNNSTLTRIEHVLGEKPIVLLDSLDELARQALMVADGNRLVCRHDLLGMSALSEISPLSLQLLHHRAAEALEAEFSESPDGGRLWDAARHREAAGETERAVELLDQCATRAMALGTPGDAAQALGYALSMAPAGHLRDTLHARRIHALYLGREYTGLVAAADAARRERGGQVDTTTAHTAEELFELDATLFALGPTVALIDRATACAKAAGAEPDHRVGAGMIALKAASMIARGRVAKRILQSVEPVLSAASPHVAAEFRLIYHGSYGSVQESANEARTLLSTLDAPKHAVLRAKALHQCSIAFYLNGELEMAERCAAEARELGVSLHIPSIVRSATQLALINAMDVGDLERADAVMASTALLADATDGVNARINDTFLAMHALLRGDLATAARWIGPFTDIFGGQYARETGAVVEQRAHYRMLADGWVPSDGDMTHMIRVHRAERLNRGGDSLLRVIVMALEMRGERARAQALVTRYLTRYRRERGPLMRQLRELLEKLGYPIADPAAPRVTAAARGTGAAEVTSLP